MRKYMSLLLAVIALVFSACRPQVPEPTPTIEPTEMPATPRQEPVMNAPQIEHLLSVDGGDLPLDAPYGVDMNEQGWIYLLDTKNQQVRVFNIEGEQLFAWGEPGGEPGQFNTLGFGSLAISNQGNVFVVDNGNFRVQKFDAEGNFLLEFGTEGDGEGGFTRAIGIATDADGNVYVTDDSVPFVQVFDNDGNYLRQFGGEGREEGQFRHATGISLDAEGNIYVADYSVKRVQVFENDGSFVQEWQIGHENSFPGTPEGITIDGEGRVYVTDYALGKVEVYTPEGEYLGDFGGAQLQAPVDIAVNPDGTVVVTDQTTSRLQVYRIELSESAQPGVALHLVSGVENPRAINTNELDRYPLQQPPLISAQDILGYDIETHTIELNEAAFQRVSSIFTLPVDVDGIPFILAVDGEPIYHGAFYTPASSLSYNGVIIPHPLGGKPNTISIQLGYPSIEAFDGEDPRSDPRILETLGDSSG